MTARDDIVAVRMEVEASHAFHVSVERRAGIAAVQIPSLDDSIFVGRVYIIIGIGESNAFDSRVVAVERLKRDKEKLRKKKRSAKGGTESDDYL